MPLFCLPASRRAAPTNILNASYDVTREFYQEYNAAFVKAYKAKHGVATTIDLSNGGSSKQARAVIEGAGSRCRDDEPGDRSRRHRQGGADLGRLEKRLPNNAAPYAVDHRVPGAQKETRRASKTGSDLIKPGVSVVVPNPKTSGNGRYSYLAAWAYAKAQPGGSDDREGFRGRTVQECAGAGNRRAGNDDLLRLQKEIGDALLTFESEVLQITKAFGESHLEVVYPPTSILAEAPVERGGQSRWTSAVRANWPPLS